MNGNMVRDCCNTVNYVKFITKSIIDYSIKVLDDRSLIKNQNLKDGRCMAQLMKIIKTWSLFMRKGIEEVFWYW